MSINGPESDLNRANMAQQIAALEQGINRAHIESRNMAKELSPSNQGLAAFATKAAKTTAQEMEELLPVLRRNGVSEYNNDMHGVRIKFAERPALEMAQQILGEELARKLKVPTTELPKLDYASLRTEPPPHVGSVEPIKYDLDDVLHGAK
jgi:hypothetical protein